MRASPFARLWLESSKSLSKDVAADFSESSGDTSFISTSRICSFSGVANVSVIADFGSLGFWDWAGGTEEAGLPESGVF